MNDNTIKSLVNEINDIGTNKRKISIAIDFDGTVVEHNYPYIGKENGNCSEILKKWVNIYNVELILDTMRGGILLKQAIDWFSDRNIPLTGVGQHPNQHKWTNSTKAYALFSIDDRNIGCPIKYDSNKRHMVDWDELCKQFEPILKKLNNNL